jgi:hypothetical protein
LRGGATEGSLELSLELAPVGFSRYDSHLQHQRGMRNVVKESHVVVLSKECSQRRGFISKLRRCRDVGVAGLRLRFGVVQCGMVTSSFTSSRMNSDGDEATWWRAELGHILVGKGKKGAAVDGAQFLDARHWEEMRKDNDIFNHACNQQNWFPNRD